MDALGPSNAPGHYEHIDVGRHEEESVGEREHDGDSQNGGKPARVRHQYFENGVFLCPTTY